MKRALYLGIAIWFASIGLFISCSSDETDNSSTTYRRCCIYFDSSNTKQYYWLYEEISKDDLDRLDSACTADGNVFTDTCSVEGAVGQCSNFNPDQEYDYMYFFQSDFGNTTAKSYCEDSLGGTYTSSN